MLLIASALVYLTIVGVVIAAVDLIVARMFKVTRPATQALQVRRPASSLFSDHGA